ncbi:hypothetical protein BDF14DRAFT_1777425 [Spinellus fusiger]|nr:hypothetical protein BDF14DRAFT_1777425 [Spinellus fusiger]
MVADMTSQAADGSVVLHPFSVRPSYEWTPSEFLNEQFGLDLPLHNLPLMEK